MSLVSIVIPCYNHAHYLPQTLESCLNQTYPHLEILVVDDGSTDNPREVVQHYPQVKYIYQENKGLPGARNTGIRESTGDFLQFLDADDLLLPEKIARCMAVFERYPDTDVVYTDFETRSPDLKTIIPVERPAMTMPEGLILIQLINTTSTYFPPHSPLIRRAIIEKTGFFAEHLRAVEDWNYWVRLAANGAYFRYVDTPLIWYRDTPQSMSKDSLRMAYGRLHAVEQLRSLALPPEINLDRMIAGRHHMVAVRLWQKNQKAAARHHLREAIRLTAEGRIARLAMLALSYFTSQEQTDKWIAILQRRR